MVSAIPWLELAMWSYPEYRGEGGISAIMKEMLADLAKQKVAPFLLSTVFISILSSIWL